MDHASDATHAVAQPTGLPQVRRVALGAPVQWLRLGARDLHHSLRPSLAIGLAFALAGWLLMAVAWRVAHLVPALLGGFLFVAPFAAIVVYGYARQLERGGTIDRAEARTAWRANAPSIALFALMLVIALIFWERVAAIVFAAFYRGEPLQFSTLLADVVIAGKYLPLVGGLAVAGCLLAAAVFALSVVSVPLLLDRPVDVITAAITSVRCCLRNPAAMLLWGLLIAVLTWIGLLTFMVGLVVVFPWLAHASWHAYRAMVE